MDIDSNLETITPTVLTTLTIGSTGGVVAPSGTTAQRPGAPVSGTLRYNTTTSLIEVFQNGSWINMGATPPATPVNSIQFNNAGVFGGSANLVWNNTANVLDVITGTLGQNRVRIGGSTIVGDATVYIETDGLGTDAQRVYFNNAGDPASSGYITYSYDISAPYISIVDGDDDPPYLTLNTIGTGSFAEPLYLSVFAARGTYASRLLGVDDGFAWHIGSGTSASALIAADTPVMEVHGDATKGGLINLRTAGTANPPVPAANYLTVFNRQAANRSFLAMVGPNANDTSLQPLLARNKIGYWSPPGNSTTVPGVFGLPAWTVTGTATTRNVATTNIATRMRRLGYVSNAAAGNLAGQHLTIAQYTSGSGSSTDGSGFFAVWRFVPSDAAAVAAKRMFCGMTSSIVAPTNVHPNTLTNAIGVGALSTDTTQFYWIQGGSAAQPAVALGTGVGAPNTLSSAAYELIIYSPGTPANTFHLQFTNIGTGVSVSTTMTGSAIVVPQSTTLLSPRIWTTNNTTALAVGVDVCSFYIETDN